jgi:hypothetical protein
MTFFPTKQKLALPRKFMAGRPAPTGAVRDISFPRPNQTKHAAPNQHEKRVRSETKTRCGQEQGGEVAVRARAGKTHGGRRRLALGSSAMSGWRLGQATPPPTLRGLSFPFPHRATQPRIPSLGFASRHGSNPPLLKYIIKFSSLSSNKFKFVSGLFKSNDGVGRSLNTAQCRDCLEPGHRSHFFFVLENKIEKKPVPIHFKMLEN